MNICIIDDDPLFCKYLTKILISKQRKVYSFLHLPDFSLIEELWIEIYIIDLHIWVTSSLSFIQKLSKKFPDIQIIISTGNISSSEYDMIKDIKIDDICIKPFSWQYIKEKIEMKKKTKRALYKT